MALSLSTRIPDGLGPVDLNALFNPPQAPSYPTSGSRELASIFNGTPHGDRLHPGEGHRPPQQFSEGDLARIWAPPPQQDSSSAAAQQPDPWAAVEPASNWWSNPQSYAPQLTKVSDNQGGGRRRGALDFLRSPLDTKHGNLFKTLGLILGAGAFATDPMATLGGVVEGYGAYGRARSQREEQERALDQRRIENSLNARRQASQEAYLSDSINTRNSAIDGQNARAQMAIFGRDVASARAYVAKELSRVGDNDYTRGLRTELGQMEAQLAPNDGQSAPSVQVSAGSASQSPVDALRSALGLESDHPTYDPMAAAPGSQVAHRQAQDQQIAARIRTMDVQVDDLLQRLAIHSADAKTRDAVNRAKIEYQTAGTEQRHAMANYWLNIKPQEVAASINRQAGMLGVARQNAASSATRASAYVEAVRSKASGPHGANQKSPIMQGAPSAALPNFYVGELGMSPNLTFAEAARLALKAREIGIVDVNITNGRTELKEDATEAQTSQWNALRTAANAVADDRATAQPANKGANQPTAPRYVPGNGRFSGAYGK